MHRSLETRGVACLVGPYGEAPELIRGRRRKGGNMDKTLCCGFLGKARQSRASDFRTG